MAATPYPIKESLDDLIAIRDQSGPDVAARIEMLLLFRNRQVSNVAEAATLLHIPERTLRRWCQLYRERGILSLIGRAPTTPAGLAPVHTAPEASGTLLARGIDFLNSLPNVSDSTTWLEQFRTALKQLLGEVDRISINVNLNARLHGHTRISSAIMITHHVASDGGGSAGSAVVTLECMEEPGGELVRDMSRKGFPVDRYHPPHHHDYRHANGAYLGTLILWRELRERPISTATLSIIAAIEPFLRFMLADCIARHQAEHAEQKVVSDRIAQVSAEAHLSRREREVLLHRLTGKTYPEIAGDLGVAVTTIHKHVESIHRKTGVRTIEELFADCFLPFQAHS